MSGSLSILGTGYRVAGQVTAEAETRLRSAERVFHLINDKMMVRWLESLNEGCETLMDCYTVGRPSDEAIEPMVDRVIAAVRDGREVCVAFPGHPSIVVPPGKRMLERAREEGFPVEVLPGVSAAACLFADLGVDPAESGWAVYEASEFMHNEHVWDLQAHLVLLQTGVIGMQVYHQEHPDRADALRQLVEYLSRAYVPDHEVMLYEVATHPVFQARLQRLPLAELPDAEVSFDTTLYVPPARNARRDAER